MIDTVNPIAIVWENIGTRFTKNLKFSLYSIMSGLLIIVCSFWGLYYFSNLEKDMARSIRSDCSGE